MTNNQEVNVHLKSGLNPLWMLIIASVVCAYCLCKIEQHTDRIATALEHAANK